MIILLYTTVECATNLPIGITESLNQRDLKLPIFSTFEYNLLKLPLFILHIESRNLGVPRKPRFTWVNLGLQISKSRFTK